MSKRALLEDLEFLDENVLPLHGRAVGLELDGAGLGKRAFLIEVIVELGLVDNELAVEMDGHLVADEFDDDGIPFSDGLVGVDEGLASGCALGIVPKTARALFCAVLPTPARFGGVPKLHLGDAAKINTAVGLGVEFEFEAEFEVGVVLFGGEEESVAIVVKDAVLDFPVLVNVFEALFLLRSELFGREREVFGRVFSRSSPPTGEVLAIEE